MFDRITPTDDIHINIVWLCVRAGHGMYNITIFTTVVCLACHSSTNKSTDWPVFISVCVYKLSLHRVYCPSFSICDFHIFVAFTSCLRSVGRSVGCFSSLFHAYFFFIFEWIHCTAYVYIKFMLYGFYVVKNIKRANNSNLLAKNELNCWLIPFFSLCFCCCCLVQLIKTVLYSV